MHGIPEQLHVLGIKVMSGAERDQPIISIPIYEFLNVVLQCSIQ